MRGIEPCTGLKARQVTARPEGPGWRGAIDFRLVRATRPLSRPYRAVDDGGRKSQGFTLGHNITGFQPGVIAALKGRQAKARPEGPGKGTPPPCFSKPCKGGMRDAVFGRRASCVPPIQGGGKLFDDIHTWGFTPGYHMTGFQPFAITALKGRDVKARAEGPGMRPPIYFFKPCKGDIAMHYQTRPTPDAGSAEVLENIKALP